MRAILRLSVLLLPALALLGACGGGDDDSSSFPGSDNNGNNNGGGGASRSTRDVDIPEIRDAAYEGKVHVEVSGDKDFEVDAEGNAIATGGFALLTFANSDAAVQIALSAKADPGQGGISLTTKDVATAAEWGKDCSVKVTQSDTQLKGEFDCGDLDAIAPGSGNAFKVKLKGTFTADR